MKNIVKKTALMVVFLALSGWVFGQEPTSIKPPDLPSDPGPSIVVNITDKGCGCPLASGTVDGSWLWMKNPYDVKYSGSTPQYYSTVPSSVIIQSVVSYSGYTAERVQLFIYPDGTQAGLNSKWVDKPFTWTTLKPSKCCSNCYCPADTQ